jgi:hypothetical protein
MIARKQRFIDAQQMWLLGLVAVLGVALCLVGWYRWFS